MNFQHRRRGAAALVAGVLILGLARADDFGLPDATDPVAGMGVNIHFTDPKPGELEMLAQGGFRWVRMDLPWTQTEKQPGVYDFSDFDRLFASLDKFHLRAVMIFDYTNPLYDQGKPSYTDAGRQAFAQWAVAAVTHFKGRGVLWEIWNEPNGDWFWKPKPNPEDYAKLAMTVTTAIHEAEPDELVTGPALSCGLPWPDPVKTNFLDVVAASGVLKYWPAITVHPYVRTSPETYQGIYAACRQVVDRHSEPGQKIAIICGESGHNTSTNPEDVDEITQGQYVARTYLVDVLEGVPLTIWYDWHDDGPNPKDGEQRFGTVRFPYHAGSDPVYDPKPAYLAAKTYAGQLAGTHFVERLKTDSPDDYLLSFAGPAGPCVVAWTTAKNPHEVKIPLADGGYQVTSFDGTKQAEAQAAGGLALTLDGGPEYITKYIKK